MKAPAASGGLAVYGKTNAVDEHRVVLRRVHEPVGDIRPEQ